VIRRVARRAAIACAVMAMAALVWAPQRPRVALGVVGGGVLVGLALWALGGLVDTLGRRGENGEMRPVSRAFPLVKFFTRHVMLAAVAYVMMVRLHLDPVGMVVGVTSVVVAAIVEAARPR
jgi:hypothetical protein